MKRVHYTHEYLMNPQHPVTIDLIGGGGTGSQVLTCLARLDATLRALDHPGLFVRLYDPDEITEANCGRQLFSYSELGLNKATCLISKVNHFFGNDWMAFPELYPMKNNKYVEPGNITITCTDTVKSRLDVSNFLRNTNSSYIDYKTPLYWIDFGNAQTIGQVVLGTVRRIKQPKSKVYETVESLKVITEYVKYSALDVEDSGPSCSLAEALEKQDLFINSILAHLGCNILWKMFRYGIIDYHVLYVNLDTVRVNPVYL